MKTITDDPEGFFDNGGWSFLDPEEEVNFVHISPYVVYNVDKKVTEKVMSDCCYLKNIMQITGKLPGEI